MESFESRGVRALCLLLEREMRAFNDVWRIASEQGVALPDTEDPDCRDLHALLRHVLGAARGHLTWVCEVLGRPEPDLPVPPAIDAVEAGAERYIEDVSAAYRKALGWLPNSVLDSPVAYTTRWGQQMAVESMLEHAVVHPMRHRLQLEGLSGKPLH